MGWGLQGRWKTDPESWPWSPHHGAFTPLAACVGRREAAGQKQREARAAVETKPQLTPGTSGAGVGLCSRGQSTRPLHPTPIIGGELHGGVRP